MLSWLASKVLAHNMSRLSAGDLRPTLRLDANDVEMRFPGQSSWAIELRGKADHERWLQRFADVGIQIAADEVVVKGFPWKQTVCVRGRSYLRSAEAEAVYENRYVIWGRMAWGLLKQYEVYEDTQKTAELDLWLAARDQAALIS